MNRTEQRRAFIIRVVYIALVAAILYAVMKYAMPLFMPFFLAFLLAFMLKPLIRWVEKITPFKRRGAAILTLTLFYAIVGTLLTVIGIRLVVYIGGLLTDLPHYYVTAIEPALNNLNGVLNDFFANTDPAVAEFVQSAVSSLTDALSGLVTWVSSYAVGMAGKVSWFVVGIGLFLIASYFLVVDYYKVTSFVTKQLGARAKHLVFTIKDYSVNVLLKFVKAYGILMSVTFVEVFIGLLILRVPSALPIALLTACVDILPVFGTGTVMIPWAAYLLITGDYFLGIALLVLYAIITIVRQVLEPRVVGKQIGLYPLLTLICMFVGARLFGFWGLFGLPVALTVIVHLNREGEIALFKE